MKNELSTAEKGKIVVNSKFVQVSGPKEVLTSEYLLVK